MTIIAAVIALSRATSEPLISLTDKFAYTVDGQRSVIRRATTSDPERQRQIANFGMDKKEVLSIASAGDTCYALLQSTTSQALLLFRSDLAGRNAETRIPIKSLPRARRIVEAQILPLGSGWLIRVASRVGLSPESTKVHEWYLDPDGSAARPFQSGAGGNRLAEAAGGLLYIHSHPDASGTQSIQVCQLIFDQKGKVSKREAWILGGGVANARWPIMILGSPSTDPIIVSACGQAFTSTSGKRVYQGILGSKIVPEMLYDWNPPFQVSESGRIFRATQDGRIETFQARR